MSKKEQKCRCDTKPCAGGCPCSKAGSLCNDNCHMGRPWESVPCLNTECGLKVKNMKPADIRKALCDAGLSPVGDKSEIQKRLAIHYFSMSSSSTGDSASNVGGEGDGGQAKDGAGDRKTTDELMNVIIENEGDYVFILSLSGKMVKPTSSKAELRKAYFLISAKVHPDKNPGSKVATKAFQAIAESFERLANPEKFEDEEEEEDDGKPAKKRKKTERFTRNNSGCHITTLKCPKCGDRWNTKDLGLEDSSYNFLMQGIKQYICGGCFLKFGCMTAIHKCPHCRKTFEYDPEDYHRKITCGNKKCDKPFGFWMFKVSERREVEIRQEVKKENEALAKKRAQQRRRAARADKRTEGTSGNEDRVREQLFLLKLIDNCPRCGWELERGMRSEDAKEHLDNCNDKKAIAAYKKKLEAQEKSQAQKTSQVQKQEDIQAYKVWEHNGRQVGQLWMLSESTLRSECKKYDLDTSGNKMDVITRLGNCIRARERKMLTMGPGHGPQSTHDVTPIHKVDEEDLPTNLEEMENEELKCVAASYGIDFDAKDVKMDLVKKLETARTTGRGLLAIAYDVPDVKSKDDDDDEDYQLDTDTD